MENRQFRRPDPFEDQKGIMQIPWSDGKPPRGKGPPPQDVQMQYLQTKSDSVAEQDTVPLAAVHGSNTSFLPNIPDRLPLSAHHIIEVMFAKVQDPEPEAWSNTLHQKAVKLQARILGWLPILALTSTLGILLASYACASSIYTGTDQENFLWLGMLLIFVPSFLRLLSPIASRPERIGLLCTVGLSVYLVNLVLSPRQFFQFDEYLHWRTVDDIIITRHLFSSNSMLPVSPLYPGLEIVTDAFSTLSGLNSFVSALIVIGISRILMILSLFMLYEQITKSARTAGIATMLYMCNPNFFILDALFVYESMALAIGTFMMFVLLRMKTLGGSSRWPLLIAWVAMGALVTTHHVSDVFFVGLLVLWTLIEVYELPHIGTMFQSNVAKTAFLGIVLSVSWVLFVASPVVDYLSSSINSALVGLNNVLTGTSSARHLFVDYTNHPTPVWEQLAMLSAMGLIALSLPFGFLCIWHRYRYNALGIMLGLVSLSYPLSQVFRLTGSGADITYRAAPYLFISVSFALAIFITQLWPTRRFKWKQKTLITFAVSVVFLGCTLMGSGPTWILMPSGYVGGDDLRSITPESIQAARWTLSQLGPNNRIETDRVNQILMGTYGDQHIVTFLEDKVDYTPVFYATHFDPGEVSILQSSQVHYLIVDLRLSTSLPFQGFYFEEEEPENQQLTSPISRQALTKFDTVPQINREFDSGNIVIYDVGELINASETP